MRVSLSSLLCVLSGVIAGCSGAAPVAGHDASSPPPADAGPRLDAPIGDDGGPLDAGTDATVAVHDASTQGPSVRWITEVEAVTIDGDRGVDYRFEYEVINDGDPFAVSLSLERCIEIAGMPETCDTQSLSALPGMSSIRFGYDPSMYAVGENHYRFHLELSMGTEVIDEDLLDLQVTVTSCMECVGS